jgi:hypothetical protein
MTDANTSPVSSPVSSDVLTAHFDEHVYGNILALSAEDKALAFQMLTDYVDVLYKILDPGNHPILDVIKGTPGAGLEAIVAAGGELNVDVSNSVELLNEYNAWKSAQ